MPVRMAFAAPEGTPQTAGKTPRAFDTGGRAPIGRNRKGYAASWKMMPSANRSPERTRETPWRISART